MSMPEKSVEIEVLGHKGRIDTVTGIVADDGRYGLPPRENRLMVVISFDPSVNSILSFSIFLPVKLYEKDAFLRAVKREGGKVLGKMLRQHREKQARDAEREDLQRALDRIAASVKVAIGLE